MQDLQSLEQAKFLFISGLEKLNNNNLFGAEIDFEASLKFAPNRLSIIINLSIVLIKTNKLKKAEKIIHEGLAYHAKNKDLLLSLAEIYKRIISLNENYAEAHVNLANVFRELNMYEESLLSYNNAIKLSPNLAEIYTNRGNLLQDLKKYVEAVEDYNKALSIKTDYAEAYSNRGSALKELSFYDEAIKNQVKAIEINPNYAEAYYNKGVIFGELNQIEQALACYEKSIEINPNYAEAYNNKGLIYDELNQIDRALASYVQAINIKPSYAEAYNNQGVSLQALMRLDEAMLSYEKSICLNPEYAEANYNKAILLLLINKFNEGWVLYQWRWSIINKNLIKFNTIIPSWNGQTDNNKVKILLWAEQGIGDEIFYFGMLKNFTEINAKITVAADKRLHTLFKQSMPEVEYIDIKKIDTECNEDSFDYQAPIGDIGLLCSVDKVINYKKPNSFFIINKPSKCRINNKILCGISWKSANKSIGLSKSLELMELSPLLTIEGVEFVSLQYGSTKEEINLVERKVGKKIHTIDELDIYNDIDGLVSLISECDFVVTTSNITAHLTGSIGKKGIVLLPFSKGKIWYWHSGKGQSFWYPSLELVSQSQMNDWTDPIQKCKDWVMEQKNGIN